ncbi:MAG: hypothetical protein KAV00_04635, partial [Phycisphaerae bacterium]|nr:hypothetical protein [Phycisphaerae bacterium]
YFVEDLEDDSDTKRAIKAFCIRCPNGSRINALSSSPRRLRSKGGDVVISELAFHDEPAELYAAAQPVTMWGDTMTVGSTHNGEMSVFNRFCKTARLVADGETHKGGRPLTPWSHHYIPITVAVDQGLVERINAERGTNFTREGFMETLRAECETEDHWLQEYMCQASTETSAWLPYNLIRTCEDEHCPAINEPLHNAQGDAARYAGVDVGRKKDLTVLTIFGQVGDVMVTRRMLTLEKTAIPEQVRILTGALREANVLRTCIDNTGIGVGLTDGLKETLGEYAVEAIDFTNPNKVVLAVPVRAHFEDRTVRIPEDAALRESLHKVRREVTATQAVRFDAKRDAGGHADEFWSIALGLHAGTSNDEVRVSVVG